MNLIPMVAPILGTIIGYFLMKYIARKMGKPFPSIGELMYPMHYKDSKLDKRYRKGNR